MFFLSQRAAGQTPLAILLIYDPTSLYATPVGLSLLRWRLHDKPNHGAMRLHLANSMQKQAQNLGPRSTGYGRGILQLCNDCLSVKRDSIDTHRNILAVSQ
jgi:hypothetical protein